MKILFTIILIIIQVFIYSSDIIASGVHSKSSGCFGYSTYLEFKTLSLPKHDKSAGETMLTIHSQKDSTILKEIKLDGIWHCIGFNPEMKRYVLGGLFQVGGWLPLCDVRYLNETGLDLKPSHINKTEWFSFISEPDDSTKYIAFIGKYDEKYNVLYILNTITDRVQVLGKPPQPPPIDSSYISNDLLDEVWQWGSSYADGFTPMDDGIIVFEKNDKLLVSFGKDTPQKRAAKRKNITYKLIK